jgi:hypothetical protein
MSTYILITLHLGFIHYIPLKSRTAASYVSAFAKIFSFFKSKSFPATHLILDNESSTSLTTFLQSALEGFEFVLPNQHRANPAERAIRTGKNHFLALLSAAHISFPPNRWHALLPLTQLTLNHMRPFALDPSPPFRPGMASMASQWTSPLTPSTQQGSWWFLTTPPNTVPHGHCTAPEGFTSPLPSLTIARIKFSSRLLFP